MKKKKRRQKKPRNTYGLNTCIMNYILQSITDSIMSANIEIKHKIKKVPEYKTKIEKNIPNHK